MTEQWFVLDVNPYPWKVPPFSPGRKGNRLYVQAGRDEGLYTYKQAIREQIESQPHELIEGHVELSFWFWRKIETYISQRGRKTRKHEADATNIQKATEDALQGLVIGNDSNVKHVTTHLVEQGPLAPSIVVVRVTPHYEQSLAAVTESFPEVAKSRVNHLVMRDIRGFIDTGIDNNRWDPTRRA